MSNKDKRTFFVRYWWLFAGVLSAVALSTALNITNTDGWIVVTNTSADDWIVNWNTSRPGVCGAGTVSVWNGSDFLCEAGGSGGVGGNNVTGYSIHACGGASCDTGYYSIAS